MPVTVIPIFTTDTIPGHACTTRTVNSPLAAICSGQTLAEAFTDAYRSLREVARSVGANAVLGAGFSHVQCRLGYEVMAYGTGVFVDPLPQISDGSP
jgi:hypothetical protein